MVPILYLLYVLNKRRCEETLPPPISTPQSPYPSPSLFQESPLPLSGIHLRFPNKGLDGSFLSFSLISANSHLFLIEILPLYLNTELLKNITAQFLHFDPILWLYTVGWVTEQSEVIGRESKSKWAKDTCRFFYVVWWKEEGKEQRIVFYMERRNIITEKNPFAMLVAWPLTRVGEYNTCCSTSRHESRREKSDKKCKK